MSTNIFAYGTLLIPAVMETVAGGSFKGVDAYLDGYARFTLRGKRYPGIIQAADGLVDGRVYLDLDEEALERINYFEDDIYELIELNVKLDNQQSVLAETYIIPPEQADCLSDEPWSLKKFREEYLDDYLKSTRSFMRDYKR